LEIHAFCADNLSFYLQFAILLLQGNISKANSGVLQAEQWALFCGAPIATVNVD
jgi:hypothetical protein